MLVATPQQAADNPSALIANPASDKPQVDVSHSSQPAHWVHAACSSIKTTLPKKLHSLRYKPASQGNCRASAAEGRALAGPTNWLQKVWASESSAKPEMRIIQPTLYTSAAGV